MCGKICLLTCCSLRAELTEYVEKPWVWEMDGKKARPESVDMVIIGFIHHEALINWPITVITNGHFAPRMESFVSGSSYYGRVFCGHQR